MIEVPRALAYAIEPMTLPDVPTVAAIEQEVFTLPWPESAFRSEVAHHSGSCYLVARYRPWDPGARGVPAPWASRERDESLVAYGAFWDVVDEAHICTLAVRPDWRGRGLGELVLLALLEEAIARGASLATLEVRTSNRVAQSLYTKYGFQHAGERRRYYTDNDEDALIMTAGGIASPEYHQLLDARRARLWERLGAHSLPPPSAEAGRQRQDSGSGCLGL